MNWVQSSKPLNTNLYTSKTDIKRVSAGHIKHEWTSWAAMTAVFDFIQKSYYLFIDCLAKKLASSLTKEELAAITIKDDSDSDQDITPEETSNQKKPTVELLNQDKSTKPSTSKSITYLKMENNDSSD